MKFKLFSCLTDNHIRDVTIMIEYTNHIGMIVIPSIYPPLQSIPAERPGSDDRRDISKISSKYIIEGNKIVFERYDHNGNLILRVPWTSRSISEKA